MIQRQCLTPKDKNVDVQYISAVKVAFIYYKKFLLPFILRFLCQRLETFAYRYNKIELINNFFFAVLPCILILSRLLFVQLIAQLSVVRRY